MYKKSNNYSPDGAHIANSPAKLDALQIGARVKKAREKKGLTRKEMTGKLFIHLEEFHELQSRRPEAPNFHIYEIEQGLRLPPAEFLVGLNQVTGSSIDEIIFGAPWAGLKPLTSRRCFDKGKIPSDDLFDFCQRVALKYGDDSDLLEGSSDAFDDEEEYVFDFQKRLLTVRKTLKLSQEEVAERIRAAGFPCSAKTVFRWEQPREVAVQFPTLKYLAAFCSTFDVSLDYIALGRYASICPALGDLFSWIPFENHREAIDKFSEFTH